MKILLVDDELHVIRAIRQLVPWEDLGISQVLEADSGRAALTVLQQESPEIVITDVVMQDLTGLELMQILQQRASRNQGNRDEWIQRLRICTFHTVEWRY